MRPITLTFDNGPTPGVTDRVVDILAANDIRTTFFCVGEKLATTPGRRLAQRAHAAGHWIGNHSYSHSVPLGENSAPDYAEHEINDTQAIIGPLAHPDRWFRPFGGGGFLDSRLLSSSARDLLVNGNYSCVLWNCVPGDWIDRGWVERALDQCQSLHWPLVVLHDIPDASLGRLEEFLQALRTRAYEFHQEFPQNCVPIVRGQTQGDLTPFIGQAED